MTFAPVGIKCPDHAGVGAARVAPQRTVRQAQRTLGGVTAPATVGLVALNVFVYLVTVYQGAGVSQPGGQVFNDGALVGALIYTDGDWYRLVTAMFLHASLLHLAFNMLALYWLGTIVEHALGLVALPAPLPRLGNRGLGRRARAQQPDRRHGRGVGRDLRDHGRAARAGVPGDRIVRGPGARPDRAQPGAHVRDPDISVGGHLGGLAGGILATFALAHFRYARPRSLGPALVGLIMVVSFVVAYVRVESYV